MTGVINLEIKNEKNLVDEISVNISSSNYFIESTVIKLEPRFIIVNKLGIDFNVFQYVNQKNKKKNKEKNDKKIVNNSEISTNSIFDENNFDEIFEDENNNNNEKDFDVVKANEQIVYNFRKIDKNFKHIIQIGTNNKKIGLSSPFKIDDISDYNIQVLIEDEKIIDFIENENEKINKEIEERNQKIKLLDLFNNNNNNNNTNNKKNSH